MNDQEHQEMENMKSDIIIRDVEITTFTPNQIKQIKQIINKKENMENIQ